LKRGLEVAASALRFDGQVPEDEMINSDGVPVYWVGYGDKRKAPQYWQLFLLPLVFGAEDIFGSPSRASNSFGTYSSDRNAVARFLYFKSEMQSIYMLLERDALVFSAPPPRASSPLSLPSPEATANITLESDLERHRSNSHHTYNNSTQAPPSVERATSPTTTQVSSASGMSQGTETTWTDAGEDSPDHDVAWRERALAHVLSGEWVVDDSHVLWVSDEDAWCCARCWAVFGLLNRKHHCRRCGGMFCNEHAPMRDLHSCVPETFRKVRNNHKYKIHYATL